MKIEQQKIKSDIDRYYDVFLKYEKLEIINEILSERNLFYNEEAYVSNALTNNGSFEYSISNIFKEDIKKKII